MIDVSTIGVKVDSSSVKRGKKELNGLGREADNTEKKVSGATSKMNSGFRSSMSLVKGLATAMVAVGAVRFLSGAIKESVEFEKNMNVINQLVKQTGASAWTSGERLKKQAQDIALSTLESVEGVMDAQKTMLTFRNVTGEAFDRSIAAAADMSAALGVDLKSATLQLGKALEDPVTGMTALTRSGTVFTQQQKDMVKEMVAAGETAEAQKFILGELEAQYGGAGKAAAEGMAGSLDTLSQRWQEFQIRVMQGDSVFKDVTDGLAAGLHWVTENMHTAKQVVIALMSAFHQFGIRAGGAISRFGEEMKFSLTNPLDFARGKIADFFEWVTGLGGKALKLLGLDGLAENLDMNFDRLRGTESANHEKMLADMKARTEQEAQAVDAIYSEMFMNVDRKQQEFISRTPTATGAIATPDGKGSSGGTETEDIEAIEAEKERLKWEGKFLSMAEGYATERELISMQEEEKLLILDNALMNEAITWEQHEEYLTKIEGEGAKAREALTKSEWKAKSDIMQSALGGISTLMNTENKKLFEVGKAAAIANSIVATWQGASEALKLGWPMGPIAAAGIVAQGFAQVASIRSQSFGGGGSSGGAATSATQTVNADSTPVATQEEESPREQQEMRVTGLDSSALFTGDMVAALAEELLGFQENGGKVVL